MKSSLKLIAGDASDRRFYREFSKDGEVTAVCMQFPKWEGGYGGDPLSWLGMQEALTKMNIPVPQIYKIDEKECTIWTEDLGDNFLSSKIQADILDIANPICQEAIHFYKEALKLILQAQYSSLHIEHPALTKAFDFEKLFYEMTFFIKHFLNQFLGLGISAEMHSDLYKDLAKLCEKLGASERVLCHRDYHVRNIMLKNDKIYWIDFQDARMGPHSYDVVSLLRDSYVEITWETRKHLFDFYFTELNKKRTELNLALIPFDDFYMETLLMGLQRNIKAIGSFGYLAKEKHKNNYLQYIFPTLNIICSGEAIVYKSEHGSQINLIAQFPSLFKLLLDLQSGDLTDRLEKKIREFK